MDYLLFTYPNCDKCEAMKDYLKTAEIDGTPLQGEELSLVQKEGKLRVREFLGRIKRDEKGAIILPVFVLREEGRLLGVFNDQAELDGWLRSRV
jgi:glutaredoxin